ncbi:alcohol dehydrogenase [Tateyamaria sp. ANG-S1]|nr:alcohol dehydrogenase [Tateyamaria sp. ANG-S1]
MTLAPVNPSDLIPITGAYAQRIVLPAVAGYEGVGRVVAAHPDHAHMLGKRVLPLRGEGTWQTHVDCPAGDAVEVPPDVPDVIAARAYINPLAAITMLRLWPVRGKTVVLSGAGSSCADMLGHLARVQGATRVVGLYRSDCRVPRLRALGIEPVAQADNTRIAKIAQAADLTFDALGGTVASRILDLMPSGATFVGYGLLTGQPVLFTGAPRASYKRFHLRDHLGSVAPDGMAQAFKDIWPLLAGMDWPEVTVFPVTQWQDALQQVEQPGALKPLLDFRSRE